MAAVTVAVVADTISACRQGRVFHLSSSRVAVAMAAAVVAQAGM